MTDRHTTRDREREETDRQTEWVRVRDRQTDRVESEKQTERQPEWGRE